LCHDPDISHPTDGVDHDDSTSSSTSRNEVAQVACFFTSSLYCSISFTLIRIATYLSKRVTLRYCARFLKFVSRLSSDVSMPEVSTISFIFPTSLSLIMSTTDSNHLATSSGRSFSDIFDTVMQSTLTTSSIAGIKFTASGSFRSAIRRTWVSPSAPAATTAQSCSHVLHCSLFSELTGGLPTSPFCSTKAFSCVQSRLRSVESSEFS
jgi:hypothetical protein